MNKPFKGTITVEGSYPSSTFIILGTITIDGRDKHVTTSSVQSVERIDGEWFATTKNSRYRLVVKNEEIFDFLRSRHPEQFKGVDL